MSFLGNPPFDKEPHETIRSADWNDIGSKLDELDALKVNRAGEDAMSGSLAIDGNLGVTGHISLAKEETGILHVNRGRLAFSHVLDDFNHTIYNNFRDIDGQGSWDGMRMNVYAGLDVRVGQVEGKEYFSALHIDRKGRVGIGTAATQFARLTIQDSGVPLSFREVGAKAAPVDKGGWWRMPLDHGVLRFDVNTGAAGEEFGKNYRTPLAMTIEGRVGIGTTEPDEMLTVKGNINLTAPDQNIYKISLGRTDEDNRAHAWAFWHMNKGYGQNSLQLWEYKADSLGKTCGGDASDGAMCNPRMTVKQGGNVGIGTNDPATSLHVAGSKTGGASPGNHIVFIQNTSNSDNADVLCLRTNRPKPGGANNFITFYGSGNTTLGSIQGNGEGGYVLASPGNDYAEWLPRLREDEVIEAGDIVGVFGGKITRVTDDAHHVMAISTGPIVLGNMPDKDKEHLYEKVAFLGQARVKVRGQVRAGDYIVASGLGDGAGLAVSPQEMTPASCAQVVGRAWESSDDKAVKRVNIIVGFQPVYPWIDNFAAIVQTLQEEVKTLKVRLAQLSPVSPVGATLG